MKKTEYPAALRDLVAQLRKMPGVGPRSAERIALWMVQARGDEPEQIARAISQTRAGIRPCKLCGYFSINELCDICSDPSRAVELLCGSEEGRWQAAERAAVRCLEARRELWDGILAAVRRLGEAARSE